MAFFKWQNEVVAIGLILAACGVADAKVWPVAGSKLDMGYHIDEAERSGSITKTQAEQFRADEQRIVAHEAALMQMHNNRMTPEAIATIETEVIKLRDRVNTVALAKADNTGKNAGDQRANAVLPQDQPNSKAELSKVIAIRKELMADRFYSLNAKNIKVICQNNHLTLRGVVDTPDEKKRINTLASNVIGDGVVDNQLEVVEK